MSLAATTSIDVYLASWNTRDPHRRRALLADAVTDDCVYAGPNGRTTGPEELDAAIVEARDYVPGASVVRVGEVEGQGPQCTFRWAVLGPAGGPLMKGTNVVEVAADGRLRRIEVVPGAD